MVGKVNLYAVLVVAVIMVTTSCSEKLLAPVTIEHDSVTAEPASDGTDANSTDTVDTQTGPADSASETTSDATDDTTSTSEEIPTDSTTGGTVDTGTDTDTGTGVDTDTGEDTTRPTSTESETLSDLDTSTDTGADTIPDTDTETNTDAETDTDTYKYVYSANFRHVGYAAIPSLDAPALVENPDNAVVAEVSNVDELIDAIDTKDDQPLIIYISGKITGDDPRLVIEGKSDLHIIGRDAAELQGVGINIRDSANILIQNLTIHHVPDEGNDCISIVQSHHIWVDHCDIYNDRITPFNHDSLLDIIDGSDYITISWNHFHESLKGLIVGNADTTGDVDAGKFHVTYHHNIFRNISPGMVSIRFGEAHIFNNYFQHDAALETIAISSRMGACVRAELNRFNNVTETLKTDQSGTEIDKLGAIQSIQNRDEFGPVPPIVPTCTLDVPYAYLDTVTDTMQLETLLDQNIGPGVIN